MSDQDAIKTALSAFKGAWKASTGDYRNRKINSERCLQAALYYHLRRKLGRDYTIFIEAAVLMGSGEKIFIDTLVCHKDTILVVAELKYKPKACPSKKDVTKDLEKLIACKNRKATADQVKIRLMRYRATNQDETATFSISPERRTVFAAYCKHEANAMKQESFWPTHGPLEKGAWKGKTTLPPKLVVCLARTYDDGTAKPEFFGRGDMD